MKLIIQRRFTDLGRWAEPMINFRLLLMASLLLSVSGPLDAQELRELETDRPDATESPVTVDRGHFQLESSFFSFSRDDAADGSRTDTWGVGESNIKYGLSDRADFQIVFTPYVRETVTTAAGKTTADDFSDVTLRLKYNLWGNDDGETAFGLMPVIKIPTDTAVSNGEWEGGIVTPFSWRAGEKWGVGSQVQIDRVYDDVEDELDWEFSHTAVVGFDLSERWGIYLEYLGVAGDRPYDSFFSGGMTFALQEFIQLDAGTLIGLNDEAEDVTIFTGISWKF